MRDPLLTAERIARAVVPDLASRPLYLVVPKPNTMLTPSMLAGRGGHFVQGLDEMLRPDLEAAGRWRGRGVAVVVDVEAPARLGLHEFDAERCIIGIALHEIAHWVDCDEPPDDSAESADPESPAAKKRYSEFVSGCTRPQPALPIPAAFWSHGKSFTRICAHIAHRTQTRGGLPLRAKWLSFARDYPTLEALASPVAFAESLADELDRLADLPLRTIAAIEPPPAFNRLWADSESRVWEQARAAAA